MLLAVGYRGSKKSAMVVLSQLLRKPAPQCALLRVKKSAVSSSKVAMLQAIMEDQARDKQGCVNCSCLLGIGRRRAQREGRLVQLFRDRTQTRRSQSTPATKATKAGGWFGEGGFDEHAVLIGLAGAG